MLSTEIAAFSDWNQCRRTCRNPCPLEPDPTAGSIVRDLIVDSTGFTDNATSQPPTFPGKTREIGHQVRDIYSTHLKRKPPEDARPRT